MTKAVLYARCASEKVAHSNDSIEGQLKALRRYAKKNKYQIVREYVDVGLSGNNLIRPAFAQLRKDLWKGEFKVLLVNDLNRLSRNVVDWLALESLFQEHGIQVVCVNGPQLNQSPAGSFAKMLLVAASQFERESLAERVRQGLKGRKAKRPVRLQAVGSLCGNN
ncbi:MAG: recombinase family protein [Patescibacteria group bacterium]|nr:recombinase family protein [Patescibacteria group bacterium]